MTFAHAGTALQDPTVSLGMLSPTPGSPLQYSSLTARPVGPSEPLGILVFAVSLEELCRLE